MIGDEYTILSAPSVNWSELFRLLQNSVENPTRVLDTYNIDKKSPLALPTVLASIDQKNNFEPRNYFSKLKQELLCVDISVMVKTNVVDLCYLILPSLRYFVYTLPDNLYILIIIGNLNEWYNSILFGSGSNKTKSSRDFYNNILNVFEGTDLRHVFKYKKISLKDGTQALET